MNWKKELIAAVFAALMAAQLMGCSAKANDETTAKAAEKTTAAATTATAEGAKSSAATDPVTGEAYPEVVNVALIEGGPESAILSEKKYLDELDVKVNVVTYSAGTDINNAIVSGDVDVASFGSSPVALGIANKIPYKAVFVPYVQGGNIEALVAKNETGAKTVADLKGKTIAAPFGTTSHYALLNALELAGLGASDVTLLDMGGQDIVAAWTRGDIDAAYIWSPALDECRKDGSILTNDGELAEQGVLIPEIAVAADGFAEKYPTLVSQYVYALIKANQLVNDSPQEAVAAVAAWEGISEESAKGQIDDNIWVSGEEQLEDTYLGTSEKKGSLADTLKTIADFHQSQGNIKAAPDRETIEKAIDPSFAQLALKNHSK